MKLGTEPHVLIVSSKVDTATDSVVCALQSQSCRVTRLNTEDLPYHSFLTRRLSPGESDDLLRFGTLDLNTAALNEISGLWYRRVRSPEKLADMATGVHEFCVRESRAAVLGTLLSRSFRAMSPPPNVWAAEHKLFQLAAARSCGFRIPETLVTNDPREIRNAFEQFHGQMIVKPVRSGFVEDPLPRAVYTSQVLEEHLTEIDSARWCPAIYQPLVRKHCDVRVTIVGSRIFAAEIDSQTDPAASVDWRKTTDAKLPHRRVTLPDELSRALTALLSVLGLAFGAIDLIRTPSDEYVFLEINPNGQWLWLEDLLGFRISEAVATWLSASDFNQPIS